MGQDSGKKKSKDLLYYILSLGCSKNLVDSEKINGEMAAAGYLPAESSEDANIIIVNTCGFINSAKEESIEVILDAIEDNESARVAVVGCLTERYRHEIMADIPEIDFVYGLPDKDFVEQLSSAFSVEISAKREICQKPLIDGLGYSYIKISEGCSNNCSYCAIPLIRGGYNPYPADGILRDAETAASNGALELNIVAQDIASYRWNEYTLARLVDEISQVRGIEWIRLMYCHPDHLDDEIITLIKNNEKVVRYIDLPFQHASKNILHSMGREGDFDRYYELIQKLRDRVPGIRIRSTFMMGYPGETDADFNILIDFLKKARIDRVGGFIYSHEENTSAFGLSGQVPPGIMEERYEEFMRVQQEISFSLMEEMIGSEVAVLIEEQVDENTYLGRTEFDAPEVDGIFYLTAQDVPLNSIVRARITDAVEYDLIGELF
ncbi:MAG: 30S ribosomal protein S12 methylthiotransferase RimO [bacterium]|nr:30S ribosomal protein S12 methylthiotransferase RimO [bacterium]